MESTSIVPGQVEPQSPEPKYIQEIEFQCSRDKNVTHRVQPMILSLDNIERIWKVGKQYRTIFGQDYGDDFWKFVSFFVTLNDNEPAKANGLFWLVDDFAGMFYMTNIDPTVDAMVHFAFYKPMGACKTPLIRLALKYCFDKYQFHRISTEAPLFAAKHTFKQIEELGFVWEGRRRAARYFDGKYFHVNYYGLLREEFEKKWDTILVPSVVEEHPL